MISSALFADVRRGWLQRLCAMYFVASILVPTMAPFRTISFADLAHSSVSPSGRIAPSGIATRDTALASPSLRHLDRRLKTRLKVIADAEPTTVETAASFASRGHAPDAGASAHRKPSPILRI